MYFVLELSFLFHNGFYKMALMYSWMSNQRAASEYVGRFWYQLVVPLQTWVYLVFVARAIGRHEVSIRQVFSNIEDRTLGWLRNALVAFTVGLVGVTLSVVFPLVGIQVGWMMLCAPLADTAVVYYLAWVAFVRRPQDTEPAASTAPAVPAASEPKYEKSSLSEEQAQHLLQQLETLMKTRKPHTNPDLTLAGSGGPPQNLPEPSVPYPQPEVGHHLLRLHQSAPGAFGRRDSAGKTVPSQHPRRGGYLRLQIEVHFQQGLQVAVRGRPLGIQDGREMRVAVDLGGTKILSVAEGDEGPGGPFLARHKVATQAQRGRDAIWETLVLAVERPLDLAGAGRADLEAVGVCVPGAVVPATGEVRDCSNLPGWTRVPLGAMLTDQWGVPVTVTNDARAACWAEFSSRAGRGSQNMAFVTLSTGIGAGFVFEGKLYQGSRGIAGELGETRDETGGTHERNASGSALLAKFGMRAEDLRGRYEQGEPRALEAFHHLASRIGRLLANVAPLIDPDLIVVGGGLSQLGPWLLDPLAQTIRVEAHSLAAETPLVTARWSEDAGVRGLLDLLDNSLTQGNRP